MKLPNREFARIFDEVAHQFDNLSNPYTLERRYKDISEFTNGDCLEVGAGTGSLIAGSKRKSKHVLSDISLNMCKVSGKKYNCNVVCCDAEKLSFRDKSFDTIISSEMIYYLNDPEGFIRESSRILRPKGTLVIMMANQDMKIYDKARKLLRKIGMKKMYFDDGIESFMKLKDLRKMLDKEFRVKKIKKIVVFPTKLLHAANIAIEKTFLKHLCAFVLVVAEKK
jgi:ubiquinone/menaquinone biosynthesis C-methylase UbiE